MKIYIELWLLLLVLASCNNSQTEETTVNLDQYEILEAPEAPGVVKYDPSIKGLISYLEDHPYPHGQNVIPNSLPAELATFSGLKNKHVVPYTWKNGLADSSLLLVVFSESANLEGGQQKYFLSAFVDKECMSAMTVVDLEEPICNGPQFHILESCGRPYLCVEMYGCMQRVNDKPRENEAFKTFTYYEVNSKGRISRRDMKNHFSIDGFRSMDLLDWAFFKLPDYWNPLERVHAMVASPYFNHLEGDLDEKNKVVIDTVARAYNYMAFHHSDVDEQLRVYSLPEGFLVVRVTNYFAQLDAHSEARCYQFNFEHKTYQKEFDLDRIIPWPENHPFRLDIGSDQYCDGSYIEYDLSQASDSIFVAYRHGDRPCGDPVGGDTAVFEFVDGAFQYKLAH